jgi:hypothetical protein
VTSPNLLAVLHLLVPVLCIWAPVDVKALALAVAVEWVHLGKVVDSSQEAAHSRQVRHPNSVSSKPKADAVAL